MDDQCCELREIHRLLAEMHRRLHTAIHAALTLNLPLEGISIMAALDDLKALGPRLDAVIAALPADVANAVAAQKAADDAAVTDAQNALATAQSDAATAESNLASTVTDLTAKVASLEAAAGVQPPAPPPPPA